MEPRKFAAILSSLISQLILLLLLILPSNSNHSFFNSNSTLIVHHVLLSHQIAASLSSSTRRNKKRPRTDPYPVRTGLFIRSPDSFVLCFKMKSSTFEWLAGLLEPLLDCRDPLPLNLTAGSRLGIGLFRLAKGLDYPEISTRFGVPVSVAKFCVKQLCRVLCTNFRFWISFPNPNELGSVSQEIEGLTSLPHCCGVLHCTRFEVVSPRDPPSPPSPVAAQLVVDSSCRILSVAAGFFGRKSNSRILKSSSLFQDIEEGTLLNSPPVKAMNNGVEVDVKQYLVGGGEGYPLLPWLMVPFTAEEAAAGSNEESFNVAIDVTKIPAIRTAASLRNWGVLDGPVLEEVKVAVAYIGACSILHNGLLMREDFSALAGEIEGYQLQQQRYKEFCRLDLENDDSITEKALVIRSTLATMVKKNS
ncbi:hypothetical protein HN51_066714 [Arachis hypogaea]|nr:protein ALP1-like [Arachis hypogaea]QHO08008.1 Harbinger transposase-derived nuclease [Arachis hypogaea]